jgi:hypothetical protein
MVALPVVIPLDPVPSQVLNVTLGTQPCRLKVYTKRTLVGAIVPGEIITEPPRFEEVNPVFLDLYVNDEPIFYGALGVNEDPQVSGIGSRWLLCWWPDL